MRYLLVTAVALLSWSWAQQRVSPSQEKVNRLMRIIERERARGIVRTPVFLPLEEEGIVGNRPARPVNPAARTSQNVLGLSWLLPHQDADTVPTTSNTTNVYGLSVATDTLLAPGVGSDVNPNLADASICEHHYLDSLAARGAFLGAYIPESGTHSGRVIYIGGNCLDEWETDADTAYVFGGRAAQRYSFRGVNLQIKGIAAFISKNRYLGGPTGNDPGRCQVFNQAPNPDDGDGAYTLYFMLMNTDTVVYGRGFGPGTYPGDTLRMVAKPATQVRLASLNLAQGQCVLPDILTTDINENYPTGGGYYWHHRLMERLMYVYFDTPYQVNSPEDLYVAVAYEMYDPYKAPAYTLQDTFFIPIGPFCPQVAATGDWATHPCRHDSFPHPDTLSGLPYELGRCMVGYNEYNTANEAWQFTYWRPERTLWTDREGYLLDFPIFPIISSPVLSSSMPVPIRSGSALFYTPYPNPAVECLHLKATLPADAGLDIYLITTDGRIVRTWSRRAVAGENIVVMDINDIPAGAYLLQAQSPYGAASFWVNVVK